MEPAGRATIERQHVPDLLVGRRARSIGGRVEDSEKIWVVDEIPLDRAGFHLGCDPDVATGRWYALYVRSRHEKVVESGLRGRDTLLFPRFTGQSVGELTESSKSMCLCFQDTSFATLILTSGCQF